MTTAITCRLLFFFVCHHHQHFYQHIFTQHITNLGNNPPLSFLPNLDKNDGNNDPLFPTNKYRLNFDEGITFTQT